MRFAKLHGLGNDFVLLDRRADAGGAAPDPAWAARVCDRHRGVGADGVLTLLPEAEGARLVIHNADGSRPEMCGNGARIAALWIATGGGERLPSRPGETVLLHTDAGPRPCRVWASAPGEGEVEVGMGPARIFAAQELLLGDRRVEALPVSMGNPHRVIALEGSRALLQAQAERFGRDLCLQQDANIELAAQRGPQRWECVVYERGAGLTQACGTGACAVAAAAIFRGQARAAEPVVVELPGGPLSITVAPDLSEVRMRGPAQLVFRGELPP